MNNKYFILGMFVFLALKGFSQFDNYVEGYVVKESKDTIFGKLKIMNDVKSCSKIKFIDSNNKKVKFKKKEVLAYKRGYETFVKKRYQWPLSIGNMQGFMKLINNGEIKLYQFSYLGGGGTHMNANGTWTGGGDFPQQAYYLEKEGKLTLVNSMGFKNKMTKYFSDNKELADKIRMKELRYRDIMEIVAAYNKN